LNLALPKDIEEALTEQARKQETTPEQLAIDSLRERFASPDAGMTGEPGTLFEFLSGYIGVLHSSEHVPGGAALSEKTETSFTDHLLKKRAQGRL